MAKFTVETRGGSRAEIAGKDGVSLMKLIRRAGIEELEAQCGGSCACATCHVYLALPKGAQVAEMTPGEARMLATASDRTVASRLSCQIKFDASLDGLHVAPSPRRTRAAFRAVRPCGRRV
jgi:2Fe-2S ferredoxin